MLLLIIIIFVLIVLTFLFVVKKNMIQLLQVRGQKSFLGKGKGLVISSIKLGKRKKLPGGFVVRWTYFLEKNEQIQCI